ncbi:MAG: hypothetical protein PVF83_03755 [Anaerolineales bacterium]|jgi:hypothetical protein
MNGAHIAAQEAAKKRRQEEEEMTKYTKDELDNDWEFKIVKSALGKFSKREVVDQVRAEESMAGWVMVEKFDDSRIRFKRPFSAQRNDFNLPPGIDPYRTTFGMSEGVLGLTIVGVMLGIGGLIALLAYLFS